MTTTTPAREPVVEIRPAELRVVGVRILDSEYIVLRNIAARMKEAAGADHSVQKKERHA